ncbi:ubiquinol oxidase subunit II [Salinisphaera hydrothermalis]|uniref:ubiquinol oxidase subunit II n=1 Tax=Salinisphaera hydrothermalis TaxID=563188 RepID=UPI00068B6246|nr:ubiquinol oxidase subunit II [Salinisphaera hydrothermalis]
MRSPTATPDAAVSHSRPRKAGAGLLSRLVAIFSLALFSLPSWADSLFWTLDPAGPVARSERYTLIVDAIIMAVIVIPTIILTVIFLRRYRASNTKAGYAPTWSRSIALEIGMWGIPLIAVGVLGYFVYTGTQAADPYHPGAIEDQAGASSQPALTIDVIALDWRWLFVYPKQHIATVHTLTLPVNRPVRFHLTSATVTNSFFIPRLAGQIYVMPGMHTQQLLQADKRGTYTGFSAAQSGAGFSWMRFKTHVVKPAAFQRWVARVQASPDHLTHARYEKLVQPTIDTQGKRLYFSSVAPGLFDYVTNEVRNGKVYPTHLFAGKKMK